MVSAFSMPKSTRKQRMSDVPGPGVYNPQNNSKIVKKTDPQYSFGRDGRKQSKNFIPGPGSYQPVKDTATFEKKPSYTMLKRRDIPEKRSVVGPGAYQPKYEFSKDRSVAYSMHGRSHSTIQSKPGPGQYEQPSTFSKGSGRSFGKGSGEMRDSNKVPGPGSYDSTLKLKGKQEPSYGFGSRIQMKHSNDIPGPGQYHGGDNKIFYSKIGGIISRDMSSSMIVSRTPGPGSYDQNSYGKVKGSDPQWSISRSSRQNIIRDNPVGPGYYDFDKNSKKVNGHQFGVDKRDTFKSSDVPGPGSYENYLQNSRIGAKFGQKPKDLSKSYVPGPGSYEAGKYDSDAWLKGEGRYTLGRSSRDDLTKNNVPGPGSYEKPISARTGPSFGKDLKSRYESSKTPGPGQYDLKPYFADVPKYLLPNKV